MNLKTLAATLMLLGGLTLIAGPRVAPMLSAVGKPSAAYVVIESASLPKLPESQLLWLNSEPLRQSCRSAGFELRRVDPDTKAPTDILAVIQAARKRGLPSLVTQSRSGSLSAAALPLSEQAARKALGVPNG